MVNKYGVVTAAAYGAALQLWAYVQMPAMAVGAACSSMAAQNVGAGLWPGVHATARTGVPFNFLLTGALILPILLLDRWTMALFLPSRSPLLEAARHLDHVVVGSFRFFGVTFVLFGVVRATGAVVAPAVMLAIALWGIRIPFAALLRERLGADAIRWSFPVSSLVAMGLAFGCYRFGGWRGALPGSGRSEVAVPAEVPRTPPGPVADVGQRPGSGRNGPWVSGRAALMRGPRTSVS